MTPPHPHLLHTKCPSCISAPEGAAPSLVRDGITASFVPLYSPRHILPSVSFFNENPLLIEGMCDVTLSAGHQHMYRLRKAVILIMFVS